MSNKLSANKLRHINGQLNETLLEQENEIKELKQELETYQRHSSFYHAPSCNKNHVPYASCNCGKDKAVKKLRYYSEVL